MSNTAEIFRKYFLKHNSWYTWHIFCSLFSIQLGLVLLYMYILQPSWKLMLLHCDNVPLPCVVLGRFGKLDVRRFIRADIDIFAGFMSLIALLFSVFFLLSNTYQFYEECVASNDAFKKRMHKAFILFLLSLSEISLSKFFLVQGNFGRKGWSFKMKDFTLLLMK